MCQRDYEVTFNLNKVLKLEDVRKLKEYKGENVN